jgi:5'-phosphate synthase pdxT subunit
LFVGVLALQGDYEAHSTALKRAGIDPLLVRSPDQLDALDGLVIPGGESTTIRKLATEYGLVEPIRSFGEKRAIFGTCAGMIACAKQIADGDEPLFDLVDIRVRRNAYGRQVDSFETDIDVRRLGAMHAVFIRAPAIEEISPGVEVLATHEDRPVLVRQGLITLAAFHPELTDDPRLHRLAFDVPEG